MTKQDFSDYHSEAIPKIIAFLQMTLRYGDGEDNVLKKTKDGSGKGLDVELTLLDTEHARRKFFAFMLVLGETEGQKSMAKSNRERLETDHRQRSVSGSLRQEPGGARPALVQLA